MILALLKVQDNHEKDLAKEINKLHLQKPKPPSGQSRKKWKQQQRTQRRQSKEEARKQSERQEEADRKTGQQKPSDTTDYGDMARKIGATAAVLGGLEYVRRRPGYGPNNPRPTAITHSTKTKIKIEIRIIYKNYIILL